METGKRGGERYHGSPAAAVYQALIRWREGYASLYFFFLLRSASRDSQMQIPDRIYSACRKCATTEGCRVPVMEIADPLSF